MMIALRNSSRPSGCRLRGVVGGGGCGVVLLSSRHRSALWRNPSLHEQGRLKSRRSPPLLTPSRSTTSSSASPTTASATRTAAPPAPPPPPPPPSSRSFSSARTTAAVASLSLAVGFAAGRWELPGDEMHHSHRLPSGMPRTCCEDDDSTTVGGLKPSATTSDGAVAASEEDHHHHVQLGSRLRAICGKDNVLDGQTAPPSALRPYCTGARLGHGSAAFVVTPRSLTEVVDCVQTIVDANCVVLPQGRNTGLTGGSVPHLVGGGGVDAENPDRPRPTVVLSMAHLDRMFPIDNGQRVVCLAGTGLAQLQQFLEEHFPDRESHSTLGSTFLNPTTAAGVALGSGGTQLRKGPAYTERALYIKVSTNKWRENVVEVVNTLGVRGLIDKHLPEGRARKMDKAPHIVDTWSRWICDQGLRDMKYSEASTNVDAHGHAPAHDVTYRDRVCRVHTDDPTTVARYNADTRGPDPNRSEGKVVILATVHDTFPKPNRTQTLWISTDSLETALALRREVCLDNPQDLPISVEYVNRDSYQVIDEAGRLMAWSIRFLGPSSPWVRRLWNVKSRVESLPFRGADLLVDRFLHGVNPFVPSVLPAAVRHSAATRDHHIALTLGDFGGGELDRVRERLQKFSDRVGPEKLEIHDCTSHAAALTAFRFVAAPAFRTWCVGTGTQGISVDYALPLNGGAEPRLEGGTNFPGGVEAGTAPASPPAPLKRMRYSHFGCNVVHEDLAYAPGIDVNAAKKHLKAIVERECHGKLPAEHGHGTEYVAPKETQERWKRMDPLNVLNPGVGGLSEKYKYQ